MILSRRNQEQRRPSPPARERARLRRGLTLTELLVTIGLMVFLASIALFGLWEAQEVAREGRARSQVERINALLTERWDDYSSRAVPIKVTPARIAAVDTTATANSNRASYEKVRVNALRETGRFEMPDRILDVDYTDANTSLAGVQLPTLPTEPSLLFAYRRILGVAPAVTTPSAWTTDFQGAECLYAILATMTKGDQNGLDFFKATEIGDRDGDGRLEVWDPWGNPIEFIRWAPGLDSPLHKRKEVQTIQSIGRPVRNGFRLQLGADPTNLSDVIQFNADADTVRAAIENMADNCSPDPAPLDPDAAAGPAVVGPPGGPWTVRFAQDVNPPLMTLSSVDFTLDNNLVDDTTVGDAPNLTSVRVTTDFTDPFDPNEAWAGGPPLHFLVVSAGRDQRYGLFGLVDPDDYATFDPPAVDYSLFNFSGSPSGVLAGTDPPCNPYRKALDPETPAATTGRFLGETFNYAPVAVTSSDRGPSTDNLSNHLTDAG